MLMHARLAGYWPTLLLAGFAVAFDRTPAVASAISGRIQYYTNRSDIADVTVQAQGAVVASARTDAAGRYVFADVADGSVQLTPQKLGDAAGAINAVDALYALQAAVGVRTLNESQRLACDVNGDGIISASDAVLMLQYAVGMVPRMPVALRCGSDWAFAPEPAVMADQQRVAPQVGSDSCVPGSIAFQLAAPAASQDFVAVLFGDCNGSWRSTPTVPPTPAATPTVGPPAALHVQVLGVAPHDSHAFTQGLLLHNGQLYESAGLYGASNLREVDRATGHVVRTVNLASNYFGEGLAFVGNRLIQLTWVEHVAFVYDLTTFGALGQFTYTTQGWGICYDGTRLVMSDGSSTLYFRDPTTFAVTGQVGVTLNGQPRFSLNELECVGDAVYANIWLTDTIVKIDPRTGVVTAVIDASGLLTPAERAGADVLNGIAYDDSRGTFLITGKLWPKLFEVQFVPNQP
jgi:glutamine cyclotransferase